MIDFSKLADGELTRLGFAFELPEETELFAKLIQEELEVRVGLAVGQELTDAQLLEFNRCQAPDESALWLEENCPDYREITREVQAQLEEELLEYRARIPGAVPVPPLELRTVAIEDLGLSAHSYNCLKRAGLNTVGDIVDHGHLSRIPQLKQRNVERINARLWELMEDSFVGSVPDYYDDGGDFRWRDDDEAEY